MTSPAPDPLPVVLDREDAVFIFDVLELTDRYLHNPYRLPALAAGIALSAATAASCLARRLHLEEDH